MDRPGTNREKDLTAAPESSKMAPHAGFEGLRLSPAVGLTKILLEVPEEITGPWSRFANALLTDGRIPPAMRELAILRTASRCGSDYIIGPHLQIGRHLGLTGGEVALALAPPEPPAEIETGSPAQVVIAATDQMLECGDIDDGVRRYLENAVGRGLVTELAMVVGQYVMVAFICKTARLDPEPVSTLDRTEP